MAKVTDRSSITPSSVGSDDSEGSEDGEDIPLGTFLYEALPDSDIDSVEAVRELREQE